MTDLSAFFLIVFIGVFFSMVRGKFHLPWVVALIIGGIISGPQVFNLIEIRPTVEFIGQVGLIFLMFMAGLETNVSSFNGFKGKLFLLSFINGFIPFLAGLALGWWFGFDWMASLLIGITFVASSISIVIPSLESRGLLHSKLGQSVVMTSVIQDVASLLILSIFLQNVDPVTALPLWVFYPLLILLIALLRYLLPWVASSVARNLAGKRDIFQQQFRTTFLILLGTVILFEILGMHPIIGGFFAGFVLAETFDDEKLKDKIRTISYGIFVPSFFVIVGAKTDISVFWKAPEVLALVIAVIIVSAGSKFLSGWLGAKVVGFSGDESLLFATSSIASMSTTLAVAFTAHSLGFIGDDLIVALVTLSIVSVIISPVLMDIFGNKIMSTLTIGEKIRSKKK